MSKTITLKNPSKMGKRDPQYGQTYWSHNHDFDAPVKFNYMGEEDLHDGQVITADTVELVTSKTGNDYYLLRKVKLEGAEDTPKQEALPTSQVTPKKEWQPRDDDRIVAQWAIGQATQLTIANGKLSLEDIEADAKRLFAMVERVKGGSESPNPKSGYDLFKESRNKFQKEDIIAEVEPGYEGSIEELNEVFPD